MIEFEKEYLNIINEQKYPNIISQGVIDKIKEFLCIDKIKSTCKELTSINFQEISKSQNPMNELENTKNKISQSLPFMKKAVEKIDNAGKYIGKKIDQSFQKVFTKSQQVQTVVEGQSQTIQKNTKIAMKDGLIQGYNQNIYPYTQRELKIPDNLISQETNYIKINNKKLKNQIVLCYKKIIEECIKNGKLPVSIISQNIKQQKPIIFKNFIYTFKNKNNKLICEKKYTNSNKKIIYENINNKTKISSYKNNKLISEEIISNKSQNIINEAHALRNPFSGRFMSPTILNHLFVLFHKIIKMAAYGIIFLLLAILKLIGLILSKIGWTKTWGIAILTFINPITTTAQNWSKAVTGSGLTLGITAIVVAGVLYIIYKATSSIVSNISNKNDSYDELSLIQDFEV